MTTGGDSFNLIHLVCYITELADPEQSIQLHNLQGDVAGEQILRLQSRKTQKDQR